ncbi:polysaccharide biosynthesis/export family protein [Tautonia marina]|uniref:polysaccharide biosynthesis/export family protein n=1 Tax=Tautonia marina TaxID=2653855 RepID=UPI001260FE9D|nr:polysaccharide biosynthesis/export family protein [Tautonia marina]
MTGRGGAPFISIVLGVVTGLVVLGIVSGCSLQQRKEARRIPQYGVVDLGQPRELNQVILPPYVIEPPDELEVIVRPSSIDLTQRVVTVQPDGVIDLGFGGVFPVVGLTLEQAEAVIAERLTARLKSEGDPPDEPIEVSVRLANASRSKFFYVIGAVSNQGPIPYMGGETVLRAILQAGLRPNSLPEKAYLSRPQTLGQPDVVLRIDWEAIRDRGDTTTNYQVFPGDRIVVPGTKERGLLQTLLGG